VTGSWDMTRVGVLVDIPPRSGIMNWFVETASVFSQNARRRDCRFQQSTGTQYIVIMAEISALGRCVWSLTRPKLRSPIPIAPICRYFSSRPASGSVGKLIAKDEIFGIIAARITQNQPAGAMANRTWTALQHLS
jgi:hypothetical protein